MSTRLSAVRWVAPPRPYTIYPGNRGSQYTSHGEVVSPKLHIVDDGQLPGGLHSRTFDDRGSFPVPVMLLQEGVIAGRYLTPERARSLDTRPTGHVWSKGLASNNLVMRAGTRSINAMLTERKGLSFLVDDLPNLSKVNLRTGHFRAKVNGIVMQDNKAVGAMRGVTLTGNLGTLFNNIVDLCNNTDRIGHVDAAAIIADGLELTP